MYQVHLSKRALTYQLQFLVLIFLNERKVYIVEES